MNQVLVFAVHVSVFLSVLIFCALLALPLKLFFHVKFEPPSDKVEVANPNSNESAKVDDDFRSMKKCPYDYSRVLMTFYVDDYDENCRRFPVKPAEMIKARVEKPHVRIIRKVVTRRVCHPHKKKGTVQNKCSNMNVVEEVPQEVEDNFFPYVNELILKMVLVGLMISAVVERVNFHLLKNMETAGAINAIPKRRSSFNNCNNLPRSKNNYNGTSNQNNVQSNYNLSFKRNNYNSMYGSLGARPYSLVRRSSCPTDDIHNISESLVSDESPNLRCLRRNTLMFRRR